MMAQLRICLTPLSNTFEQQIKRFSTFPRGYQRLDWITIKSSEQKKRGHSIRIIIRSIKSKLPRDMNKFMLNDENKTSLLNLIFQYIIREKENVTSLLNTKSFFYQVRTSAFFYQMRTSNCWHEGDPTCHSNYQNTIKGYWYHIWC